MFTNFGTPRDTGNGAIVRLARSPHYPHVVRVSVRVYAVGKGNDETYYQIDGDPSSRTFSTAMAAEREAGAIRSIPTSTLAAELAARE